MMQSEKKNCCDFQKVKIVNDHDGRMKSGKLDGFFPELLISEVLMTGLLSESNIEAFFNFLSENKCKISNEDQVNPCI